MKKNFTVAPFLVLVLVLGACTTTSDYTRRTPAPVEDKIIIDGTVMPLPEQPSYQVEALEAEPRVLRSYGQSSISAKI